MAVIGNKKYEARIAGHFAKYPDKRSAVMPMLYIAQEEYGWLNDEAIHEVAQLCEMDPTQVKSIAGFYTMYREKPKGKYWLYVCTDLPCALKGADELHKQLLEELDIEESGVTADGMFTAEHVMCLGACDRAPMMQCNFRFGDEDFGEYRDLDIDKVRQILDGIRKRDAEKTN